MKIETIKHHRRGPQPVLLALAVSQLFACGACAQGVAMDQSLAAIVVTGSRSPLDPNLPTTTESKTAAQLREQNFVNVEDALKYMPNLTIRKRYIGDRNALIGGRSSSNLQAPRGLVYADGYLLSQFLGQFNAPRWNVVAPEELARVDVLYGPYSAIYPGNSIGSTVIMTTRQAKKFEASAKLQYFTQHYEDAGYSGSYGGHQASAWLGDKAGDWTYSIGANRLKNKSQPMQYVTLQSAASGVGVPVTGAIRGLDPSGRPWYLAGPNGAGLEDSSQEQFKLKAGYDFSPVLYGEILYSYWHNDSRRHGASILRDAAGNTVDSGLVNIGGAVYRIPAAAFSPQNVEEAHGLLGLKLTTKNKTGWNASAVATLYDIATDVTRSSASAPSSGGLAGSYADGGGTGWKTLDLQGTHTPARNEAHALSMGYHSNRYRLENLVFDTANWLNGSANPANLNSGFFGKTGLQAFFVQDAWRISPRWQATLGLRHEQWKAYDGKRVGANNPYPERSVSAWSPKASVTYTPDADWIWKASAGKGVRFPTVSELFQGTVVAGNIVNNDPNLKPERSLAKEFTVERAIAFERTNGTVRASIFEDDIRDTIFNQKNILVTPNVTNIQNIDRVRTRGVEFSASACDVVVRSLELTGNIAFVRSIILENANNPAIVGNNWVRLPRVRGSLTGAYRPNDQWTTSLALRHSGRQYGTLENTDVNANTFGGVSSYTVWDAKVAYRISKNLEASFGIDNLTNRKYWVFHPYPGRSILGEIRGNI
ncbi:TonB-dependent receptor [Pseudoduganella namucuonensis]|uniref:Iron complex outermembrane recepter protein n=1 Tax=Pseudoduganella namucuonensis TaxID=1035707 RepID=A0A1I7FKJ8_9BURK|nr:TonB-dependent receptor [Pseudoduganella namucuonensis]SFU36576.1 iron complex outermembrane recepter protein [Pseudoduganella namucuonensis]